MKILYRIYQVLILFPVLIIDTIIIGSLIIISTSFGNDRWCGWIGNKLGKCWGWVMVRATLLPVTVKGRENIKENQSYVIVANHQSCYDIFLLFGFIQRKIRWMMKASLMKVFVLGRASRMSGHIAVDTSSPAKTRETYKQAVANITNGVSLAVFPEGHRSADGKLCRFRRGAFMIADELQLPVVPVTILGTYEVMPKHRDFKFANWHPLTMIIHEPINPIGKGAENIEHIMNESRKAILSAQ